MFILMEIIRSLIFGAFIYFVLQFWAVRFYEVHEHQERKYPYNESNEDEESDFTKEEQRKELLIFRVLSILGFSFFGWAWFI
ncbi:hypothetical protein N8209_01375 [Gammaproteobacteria bacterium]|nr:hypothetical protein [Gammaproteobacteria bacterium]